jgi:hypothetical protein
VLTPNAIPRSSSRRPKRDTSIIDQARIVAILPLVGVAVHAEDLIGNKEYWPAIWQTLVAVIICLAISCAFRLADWVMHVDKR